MLFRSINFTFTVVFFHLKMEQQQQNMITVFHLIKCSVNFAVYKMRKDILVSLHTNQYFGRRLKPINCIVWGTENILLYSLFISSDSYRSYDITFLIVSQGTLEATHFQVSSPNWTALF